MATTTIDRVAKIWAVELGVGLAAVVMLAAGPAAAQVPSRGGADGGAAIVVLRSPSCAATSTAADRFAQLFAIELSNTQLQLVRDEPTPSADLVVEVDAAICDAGAREVGVSLVRPTTGARTGQTIVLRDVQENARSRALALAVAELVRGARHDAESQSRPGEVGEPTAAVSAEAGRQVTAPPVAAPSSRTQPTISPESRVGEVERPFAGLVQVAGSGRIFAPESTTLPGASVAAEIRLQPGWLRVRADAAGAWTLVTDPLGDVRVGLYSGGLSLLAASGDRPELAIGPHFELGYLGAVGLASGPSSTSSRESHAIALVSLTTGARFWFDRWAALVEVDLGTAILGAGVFADDRRVAAVEGVFACARAGIAFGF